jgi:hypothetical protein
MDPAGAGGYKGSGQAAAQRRERLLARLGAGISDVVDLDGVADECARSDDALDAVVCALIARAAEVGELLEVDDPDVASREGWIRLPRPGSLAKLG